MLSGMAFSIRKKSYGSGTTYHRLGGIVLFPFLHSGDEAIRADFLLRSSWLRLLWSALLFNLNYFLLKQEVLNEIYCSKLMIITR